MLTPYPTQISGARFLSARRNALLADSPRVGKTGAAIMACDDNLESSVLVVTTASGRAVWERAWRDWSPFGRSVQVMEKAAPRKADVVIVGWGGMNKPDIRHELLKHQWDRLILDEGHYAKSFEAQRTGAVYGTLDEDGKRLLVKTALASHAKGVWELTGTPEPNSHFDWYPRLRALFPERLTTEFGEVDVTRQSDFQQRYCVVRMKKLKWNRIPVIVDNKNHAELKARIDGLMLRRTQKDVGIREPIYETLPLLVSDKMRRDAEGDINQAKVLAAADAGDTKSLEMELGPIRRHTGTIVAHAVVSAVKEEFDSGLDKIVIAYWHRDVGDILAAGLSTYGVLRLDGSTPGKERAKMEEAFRGKPRVFLGQIQAAGEAIDLSPSSELIFAETSLIPKDMAQMSLRITNHTQARLPRVRVATLKGSIYETLEEILMRKWASIREIV